MDNKLPYKVETSSNGEPVICSRCKREIKDKIRLGEMDQSTEKDEMTPKWYDVNCFFKEVHPRSVNQFDGFSNLCNKEKAIINLRMKNLGVHTKGESRKRPFNDDDSDQFSVDDFAISLTPPNENVCLCCFGRILEDKVRIKKILRANGNGDIVVLWYHPHCFARYCDVLGWTTQIDQMPGFNELKKSDQTNVLKLKFRVNNQNSDDNNNNEPPAKKSRTGSIKDINDIIEKKVLTQNRDLSNLRVKLERLTDHELKEILIANDQFVPKGRSNILNHVADVILFGALLTCQKCQNGKFVFQNEFYACTGNMSEYAKCSNKLREPKRISVQIPSAMSAPEDRTFLRLVYKLGTRAITISQQNAVDVMPLFDLEFVIVGKLPKTEITAKIKEMGGKVCNMFVSKKTAAIISNEDEINKNRYEMAQAKLMGIQVVPVEFLDAVKNVDPFVAITQMNICKWKCENPADRIPRNAVTLPKSDSFYTKSVPKIQKWKNGFAVDAECDLKDVHVYGCRHMRYAAIMTMVDIASNTNSYYRMQLLESDNMKEYWLFSKHGRISTNIGTKHQVKYENLDEARAAFMELYYDLTGNAFDSQTFEKQADKYRILDITYDDQEDVLDNLVQSKLQPPIYDLMKLICDEKAMKNIMLKYECDTLNIPFGKISRQQINRASKILNELSALVENNGTDDQFIEASNHFYTLIPHDFGSRKPARIALNRFQTAVPYASGSKTPQMINTAAMIQTKHQMLERLKEIEFTYSLLSDTNEVLNPLDSLYDKMNADISALDQGSQEYQQIIDYIRQTNRFSDIKVHAQKIFQVVRQGEKERFMKLPNSNRYLLWHGSSLTNFVGILSNGLKIAPKEVDLNGAALGKGIYFSDSVSKSSYFCDEIDDFDEGDNIRLLLLCEVELGNILELQRPQDIQQLPDGKNSVKGCGAMYSPTTLNLDDGLKIPSGNMEQYHETNCFFDYNEYVVYKEAQVKIRYLVKAKFEYVEEEFYDSDTDTGSVISISSSA